MTVFWIVTGVMTLAVALVLSTALMRAARLQPTREDVDLQVYRDQLAEVDRDLARGVIPQDEADRLRTEVQRRILAAGNAAAERAGAQQPTRLSQGVAALMIAGLIGGGFATYLWLGAPGYPDRPRLERIAEAQEARENRPTQAEAEAGLPPQSAPEVEEDYRALVGQLRGAVAERPNDLQGLAFLARAEAALGNFDAAYQAQQRIIAVKDDAATAQDYADLADMKILAAGGYVSPEAERALDAALARDPDNGTARYYMGLMHAQTGRPDRTFRIWDQLLRQSTANAPWVQPIRQQMQDIAFRAGISNYAMPDPVLRGPSADDIAAAEDLSPEDRRAMITDMVQRLANRLATEGGPPAQWAQLITALSQIDETDRARAVWTEAQRVFDGQDDAITQIGAAAARAGLTGATQ